MRRNKRHKHFSLQDAMSLGATILFSLLFAFILQGFDLKFDGTVPVVDILGLLITLFLALYIARKVEGGRDKDKADAEVAINLIKGLINDIESLTDKIYNQNVSYVQASNFSKKVYHDLEAIKLISHNINVNELLVSQQCDSLGPLVNRDIRRLLTDIVYEVDDPENCLVVEKNIIVKFGTVRLGLLQKKLSQYKVKLYEIWLTLNSSAAIK